MTSKYICMRVVFLTMLLFATGCINQSSKVQTAIGSIDFLRGDLLLCGDGQFGELKFSLSCNYETRPTFDLAVALLHSFQYTEAEKAFVKVIDSDPNCPMAYWGVAMSIYHAAWFPPSTTDLIKGAKVLEIAKGLSMDEKQRDYINAIDIYYTDWENLDHKSRAKQFELKMEALYLKYPEDVEAAIFYTLALYSTRDREGTDYVNEEKAGKILESLFEDNPNHPGIAHYIIHNYDNPVLARKGLETARKYAKIAPSSSHAQHMPSHIFTRLGIWEESIASNLLSAESARCYTQAAALEGSYFEELHATDYLVYAYLQQGGNAAANLYYDQLKTQHAFYPMNITAAVYPVAAIPARIALENKNWEQAAHLELQAIDVGWEIFPWQEAIHHFARGLGAAHLTDFAKAKEEIVILQKLHQQLKDENDRSKFIQLRQVEIQIKTVKAWVAFKKKNTDEALSLMKEAVELERITTKHPLTPGDVLPARELLGDMLLAMQRPEEALLAYQENLKWFPKRFNGIYGAAVAAKLHGNNQMALEYYKDLVAISQGSHSNRLEIKEAEAFIQAF